MSYFKIEIIILFNKSGSIQTFHLQTISHLNICITTNPSLIMIKLSNSIRKVCLVEK